MSCAVYSLRPNPGQSGHKHNINQRTMPYTVIVRAKNGWGPHWHSQPHLRDALTAFAPTTNGRRRRVGGNGPVAHGERPWVVSLGSSHGSD